MATISPGLAATTFVAHADWSVGAAKRQVARARRHGDGFLVEWIGRAGAEAGWAEGLRPALGVPVGGGVALLGFDFPIGLPRAYAAAAGIECFSDWFPDMGTAPWDRFADVCDDASEISVHRPFYPMRPGGRRRDDLQPALGLSGLALRRRCEGRDAEALFWTLGGKQVGKAALSGWRLLATTAAEGRPWCWPFHGSLTDLLAGAGDDGAVVVETYPREFYRHLAAPARRWSKRRRSDRAQLGGPIRAWAERIGVGFDPTVRAMVEAGFDPTGRGEDEFDALVGLLGMIAVVVGALDAGDPADDPAVASVEGWILGRRATGL